MKDEKELKSGAPEMRKCMNAKTGIWRKGTKPEVIKAKCTQCMICYTVCPHSAIEKTATGVKINYDVCTGCMICLRECPEEALKEVKE